MFIWGGLNVSEGVCRYISSKCAFWNRKNEVFVRLQKIAFHSISKEMLGILLQLWW